MSRVLEYGVPYLSGLLKVPTNATLAHNLRALLVEAFACETERITAVRVVLAALRGYPPADAEFGVTSPPFVPFDANPQLGACSYHFGTFCRVCRHGDLSESGL